jgi:hypothetical protein
MGWTLASDIGDETAKKNKAISLPHKLATYMKQYEHNCHYSYPNIWHTDKFFKVGLKHIFLA